MQVAWQIPRNCLAWLLFSQLTVIAPQASRLPLWVLVVYLLAGLWRVMVYQGRWSFPHWPIKVSMMLACFVGIFLSYGSLLGLEPAVALLISGFSLKLIEVIKQRDVYVIIFLAYLVLLTEFIFSQDIYITVYMLLPMTTVTASLVALHQHGYDGFSFTSLRKAAVILLQAFPLMLLLFFIFPRVAPLWSVPLPTHQAKTGVSDTLSPGDISSLSQSSELAFRVDFQTAIPPPKQRYWRGLVLDQFDGRKWTRSELDQGATMDKPLSQTGAGVINYTVIQEPTFQPWLFTLAVAYSTTAGIERTADYRLQRKLPVSERLIYQVSSDTRQPMDVQLDKRLRLMNTRLPVQGNQRAQLLADQLYAQSTGKRDYINTLLRRFSEQDYVYTLNPPALGENSIDAFLFDSRRGFCGHYASSFAFLMRAVDIPARIIGGYLGGEVNPITGTVLVHQFDAHAWVEVWLPGSGWLRVDPTAAVSPERIEQGLEQAVAAEGSFLSGAPLSAARYRHIIWLNTLRMRMDALNYYWINWVLDFKGEKQLQVLKALLGEVTAPRLILLVLSVGAVVLSVITFLLFKSRRGSKQGPAEGVYFAMCRRLDKLGFHRHAGEGPMDFAHRIAAEQPQWKEHLLSASRAYASLAYEPLLPKQQQAILKLLRTEAARIK